MDRRKVRIGLQVGGEVDGDALCRLLEAVAQEGSLSGACRRLGMAYRSAWALLRRAEAELGVALVERQAGGPAGGGARLTPLGEELLAGYRRLQAEAAGAVGRYFPHLVAHLKGAVGEPAPGGDAQGAGEVPGEPAGEPAREPAGDRAREAGVEQEPAPLLLATTIGPVEVGLVGALAEAFLHRTGIPVGPIAVGSGQALELGRRGRADVLLTHAPEAEEAFVRAGYGIARYPLMYNDFVLLGPAADPAGVRGAGGILPAFRAIAAAGAPFVSRGDRSGTHLKEQALWAAAGVTPGAPWYEVYVGGALGSAATVRHAARRQAYVLVDRATYLSLRAEISLALLLEGDPLLRNLFSLIPLRADRVPGAQEEKALLFCRWATGPEGQGIIAGFRPGGVPLFYPVAGGGGDAPGPVQDRPGADAGAGAAPGQPGG
ncbi:MAG: LysR family transcriptional regulator [Bacillota bacterium]